jgi:mannose-1-phosphate guanylyltransferase
MHIMKAMVLAAGSGSRLRPLTDTVPKPLAPIGNVPLLFRTLKWLAGQGVTDAVVNASHLAERIVEAVEDGLQFGLRVDVSVETVLLGTSGAVRNCAQHFKDGAFFVIYGDNLIEADLNALLEFHREKKADATIALFTPDDISACGAVELDSDSRVTRFVEKPKPGESDSNRANAGVYIIEPHLLETMPIGFSDFGSDIFPAWLSEDRKIVATDLGGYLQDTGTPERYRKANWDLLNGCLDQTPGGTRSYDSWLDQTAEIGAKVSLVSHNCIGLSAKIGSHTKLKNCIIWQDAVIGEGCDLDDVIVGQGARIEAGTIASSTIFA